MSEFLDFAKYLSCPVVLVTAAHEGDRRIMVGTASYACLEPLVLATSIRHESHTGATIFNSGRFGLSVASLDQIDLVQRLGRSQAGTESGAAKATRPEAVFKEFGPTGTLYLADCLVAFDCKFAQSVACGPYTTIFGLVVDTVCGTGTRPLIRYDRSYGNFAATVSGDDSYPV